MSSSNVVLMPARIIRLRKFTPVSSGHMPRVPAQSPLSRAAIIHNSHTITSLEIILHYCRQRALENLAYSRLATTIPSPTPYHFHPVRIERTYVSLHWNQYLEKDGYGNGGGEGLDYQPRDIVGLLIPNNSISVRTVLLYPRKGHGVEGYE